MRLRNRKWRIETTYAGRKEDRRVHDLIVNELSTSPKSQKADVEEDYKGIDAWIENTDFDLKVTDRGLPRTYDRRDSKGFELFLWLLENQDLDRFHETNRIIVILYIKKSQFTKEDAMKIAEYIDKIPLSDYYFDIDYTLKGYQQRQSHKHYGKKHRMDIGLLIHYEKGICKTYPRPDMKNLSFFMKKRG